MFRRFPFCLLDAGLGERLHKKRKYFFFLKSVTSLATQRLMDTKEQN
ncbi:hypothetical protein HMPREF0105_0483 [Bacteroides sp. 3_1_33FAA]|uniref:Uncharacterized protein n=1 Tax=Phocaeicola dorei DSM 17855 TaxID=483217 RepID=B6W3T2_9BACT|nr:hypothetical protein BACDOR_04026 [Phocaeicola dorei DSM 17855]EEZ23101.1 hypothetical protein HMPREF0105_0483 [Bacteroides sp. 3_1_33FAA]